MHLTWKNNNNNGSWVCQEAFFKYPHITWNFFTINPGPLLTKRKNDTYHHPRLDEERKIWAMWWTGTQRLMFKIEK